VNRQIVIADLGTLPFSSPSMMSLLGVGWRVERGGPTAGVRLGSGMKRDSPPLIAASWLSFAKISS
jgi:hypothetical protein